VDAVMRIVTIRNPDQLRGTYLDLLAGHVDPGAGYVVSLG